MSASTPGGSNTRHDGARTHHDSHSDPIAIELRPPGGEPITVMHQSPRRGRPPVGDRGFTARQKEILALVAEGLSNAEIGVHLGISRRTVEKHVEAIHMKAGTTTRARLVAFAASASPVQWQRDTP